MTPGGHGDLHRSPRIYYATNWPLLVSCIAEGTDGCLYRLNVEPYGWQRRSACGVQCESLERVPLSTARSIYVYVGGDTGDVRITHDLAIVP